MNKDIDAVMRAIGGEPEIRNDEPLRRLLAIVTGDNLLRLGGYGVDTGPKILDRFVQRESGSHLRIELGLDVKFTAPNPGAPLVGQTLGLIAAQIALEIIAEESVDEIPIANAIDRKRHAFGIDAEHWNAALAGSRQHIGFARKAHEWLAVANEDGEFSR